MTRRERVIAALMFQKTDIVPYSVSFTRQMKEKMIAHSGKTDYVSTLNNHITMVDLIKPQVEVKPEFFRDEYGVIWNKTGVDKDIGVIDGIILEETDDLDDFELPPVDEAFIRGELERLVSGAGDRFRVAGIGFSLFERAWTLRGMENLLCDMLTEPEFVERLMDKIVERNMKILDIALSYDIDAVYFGDDWGQQRGLIMGPVCWRRFIKPRVAQMYARVHEAGKYVVQHSCGDIREIMDELADIGLNLYQTFQPEIYGFDYAPKLHGKIAIWGGVSTQHHLPCMTAEQIRIVTRQLLDAFPNGGLVAAPTHDVPCDVPPENIDAMMEVLDGQQN